MTICTSKAPLANTMAVSAIQSGLRKAVYRMPKIISRKILEKAQMKSRQVAGERPRKKAAFSIYSRARLKVIWATVLPNRKIPARA